jgi:hypothetical protein
LSSLAWSPVIEKGFNFMDVITMSFLALRQPLLEQALNHSQWFDLGKIAVKF